MTKEKYVTPVKLNEISDKNTFNEYLRQLTQDESSQSEEVSEKTKDLVKNIVHQLSDTNKAIIHLKFWENLTVEEIADRSGKRVSTIERIIKDSLAILKINLFVELEKKEKKDQFLEAS